MTQPFGELLRCLSMRMVVNIVVSSGAAEQRHRFCGIEAAQPHGLVFIDRVRINNACGDEDMSVGATVWQELVEQGSVLQVVKDQQPRYLAAEESCLDFRQYILRALLLDIDSRRVGHELLVAQGNGLGTLRTQPHHQSIVGREVSVAVLDANGCFANASHADNLQLGETGHVTLFSALSDEFGVHFSHLRVSSCEHLVALWE